MASERGLPTGKLPPELLRGLVLGRLGARRPETLVRAAVGVDCAAVKLDDSGWACVLKTDPITTATSGAGRLAVHVVCNDLATSGADPIGVLATLLFPSGTLPERIAQLASEIDQTARELNVEVLGGHTEVAPGLKEALVVMSGVGRARADRLLTAAGARPGDALVLTKAAALEGTHILANDLARRLAGAVPEDLLEEARGYAAELSVLAEARVAVEQGATALHDPTEGGILGAVWEMAEASSCGVLIDAERIPIRDATRAICDALKADPLRLIASGALLIACPTVSAWPMRSASTASRRRRSASSQLASDGSERLKVRRSRCRPSAATSCTACSTESTRRRGLRLPADPLISRLADQPPRYTS